MNLLAALVLTLTAKVPDEPTLKWKPSGRYEACNPKLQGVELTIDCGSNFELLKTPVSPRVCEELVIKDPDAPFAPVCILKSWKLLP